MSLKRDRLWVEPHEASEHAKVKRARITQKAIEAIASELFPQKGFGATSLDEIAEALGLTKGAFYYHVKNKEEILRRIVGADFAPGEKLRRAVKHQNAVATDRSPAMTAFYPSSIT